MHMFQAQLNAMHLNRLHATTMSPSPVYLSHWPQRGEARPCSRFSHVANSEEGTHTNSSTCDRHPHAIPTIPEVHEPLERKPRFRSRNVMSLVGVIWFCFLMCKMWMITKVMQSQGNLDKQIQDKIIYVMIPCFGKAKKIWPFVSGSTCYILKLKSKWTKLKTANKLLRILNLVFSFFSCKYVWIFFLDI